MDFRSLSEQRCALEQEFVTLKGDSFVKVHLTLQLLEFELNRLNEILRSMALDEMHVDVDGVMMIDRVSDVFELTDASSMEFFRKRLMDELKILNLCFHPPLNRTANFILILVQRLGQKISRVWMTENRKINVSASASTSQEPKPASVDDSQSQVVSSSGPVSAHTTERQGTGSSLQPDDIVARKNLERCVDDAINTEMRDNPQDFHVDQVIELLRSTSSINVDDEDVRRVIFQKCNEAIESRNNKLTQSVHGEGSSKQD